MQGNRQYKDSLFRFLFGHEERKEWTLELYNAIHDTHYKNVNDLQLMTIEDVLFMDMKNDVSFVVDHQLELIEHQSTNNANMALRGMFYAMFGLNRYIQSHHLSLHSSRPLQLPQPEIIVIYNGIEERPAYEEQHVSQHFYRYNPMYGPNFVAKIYNMNAQKNDALLQRSKILQEYCWVIDTIRLNNAKMELEKAFQKMLADMPKEFEIYDVLKAHEAEVMQMTLTEFDYEATKRLWAKEAHEEGVLEGKKIGKKEGIAQGDAERSRCTAKAMLQNHEPIEKIILYSGLSEEEILKLKD